MGAEMDPGTDLALEPWKPELGQYLIELHSWKNAVITQKSPYCTWFSRYEWALT
jgi:hypothetical protein